MARAAQSRPASPAPAQSVFAVRQNKLKLPNLTCGVITAATDAALRSLRRTHVTRHLWEGASPDLLQSTVQALQDELVWCEASDGFEASGEVVGVGEVTQVRSQLAVGLG